MKDIKDVSTDYLYKRLYEIDGDMSDWHISAYKSDLLNKEKQLILNEIKDRN